MHVLLNVGYEASVRAAACSVRMLNVTSNKAKRRAENCDAAFNIETVLSGLEDVQ